MVRHGQAEGNQSGAFLGLRDDPLTEKGSQQAHELAKRIALEQIDLVLTSPLQRASQTAAILAKSLGLLPESEVRLVEQDYGKWDGLHWDDVKTQFPQEFQAWCSGNPLIPPGAGEPLISVADRVHAAFHQWAAKLPSGSTLMLVGHAGTLQCLLCRLLSVPLRNQWPFMLATGSLTEITCHSFGNRLIRLSCQ